MANGRPRVLMVSSEVESLARTGGLGDTVASLALALAGLGADVVVVTPRYRVTRIPVRARWWPDPITAPLGAGHVRELGVLEAELGPSPALGAPRVCMVADDPLFDRDGIYGDRFGTFGDNGYRFATLSSAALRVAERAWDGALPDVVHAHDWHAALAVVYARRARGPAWATVPAVYTVHNLAYQGALDASVLGWLGVPGDAWTDGWLRHDGQVNLTKGAIEMADHVTAVSETYAREIQEPAHGHGLDGVLRRQAAKLVGIVNGIDVRSFDPRTDLSIACRYGPDDAFDAKRACKRALASEVGLDGAAGAPLFGAVSRLQPHKGIDLLLAVVPALVERGARIAVVGTGEENIEGALRAAAARWPGRVAVRTVFDPALARRVYSAADFFVVPSREEPCGLTQMVAMHYGAVPVVTPVGGLRDTVEPMDTARATGTGIVAEAPDAVSLLLACEEALGLWRDPVGMASVVGRAMRRDHSWAKSAARYLGLYDQVRVAARA